MKKRRGGTSAAKAAAIVIGGGAAIASSSSIAIVPNSFMSSANISPHPLIPLVEAVEQAPTAIRGGGASIIGAISNNANSKRRSNEMKRRPAILDSHQSDKIQQWMMRSDDRQRRLSNSKQKNAQQEEEEEEEVTLDTLLPHVTPNGKRRLQYSYQTLNHKKESGVVHSVVSKVDTDPLHFQTPPTTTAADTSTAEMEAHSTTSYYYYPMYTSDMSYGTCTNNGNEPQQYTLSNNGGLYYTLEECCSSWFIDAIGCINGFASVDVNSGELLLRDPETGEELELFTAATTTTTTTTTTTAPPVNNGNIKYYPSFDIHTYSDGACLINDDSMPELYATQEGYLFDTIEACCMDWFIDEDGCIAASSSSSSGQHVPTPSPTSSTDWPTWPVEFDYDDDYLYDDIIVPQEEEDASTVPMSSSSSTQEEEVDDDDDDDASLTFHESFESGDFSRNDWQLTSSSGADSWEADQTAWAYDGIYAARPGILSTPNSYSNLTISLENIQAMQHGGYLTFAIHASVFYPVDMMFFTINDNVIRKFDTVTGNEGEWEEVSVLLHAGEHHLSWSYQYLGDDSLSGVEVVDPRRVENSWVDAIKLRPFTGDVTIADDDSSTLSLTRGTVPFKLLPDFEAYAGSKAYVAFTEAIDVPQGSADMSWTVYVGPEGGVISFASFASLYTPLDVCEFAIDGVPQVVIATPSDDWEVHHVSVDPGKHVLTWKLIKNVSGLDEATINDVDVPADYKGYVKIDGIKLEDNSVPGADEEVVAAASEQIPDTTTTTATRTPITITTTTTTTTEEPTTTTAATTTTTATTEEPTTTTTTTTTTTEFIGCPSDLFEVEGLPGCCVEEPSYLGDGACDPKAPYNTEACAYDLGDCCHETCNPDSAYGCVTKEGGEYGPFGFFCIDPRFGNIDEKKCQVDNLEWIGDGGCDTEGGYNTPECGWDGGDCCEETCDSHYSFYPCGVNQPFTCMDPSVINKELTRSEFHFDFFDGFESGVSDPLHWSMGNNGDAPWNVEDAKPAAEGNYYIAARTSQISSQFGKAVLQHSIESFGGGVLSFDIQALVQIPFDDVIIMIDDDIVAEFTSGTLGWENLEYNITPGPHLVQWIHRKNPSNMPETDLTLFGYPDEGVTMIDNVAFKSS